MLILRVIMFITAITCCFMDFANAKKTIVEGEQSVVMKEFDPYLIDGVVLISGDRHRSDI